MPSILNRNLVTAVRARFALDWHGIHGVPHWARVRVNGLAIAAHTGARTDVDVGIAPFASLIADGMAYVSNWGGQKAGKGQASAPTGLEVDSDLVRIDAQGVAMAGTVSSIQPMWLHQKPLLLSW